MGKRSTTEDYCNVSEYYVIDCHTHLLMREIEEDLKSAKEDGLYPCYTGSDLVRLLDWVGIDRAVVFPPVWVGGKLIDPNYEHANDHVGQAVAEYPERLIGFARVDPRYGEQAHRELERRLRDGRFRGLKLNPEWDALPVDSPLLDPLMAICREFGVPVAIHSGPNRLTQPGRFAQLAWRFPGVKIIMLHMGRTHMFVPDAIVAAKAAPNLYLETTGQLSRYILAAIRGVGAERVIYGSDTPYFVPQPRLMEISMLPGISKEEKELVLGRNLATLLGLEIH